MYVHYSLTEYLFVKVKFHHFLVFWVSVIEFLYDVINNL
jgi:hypothetical protein